MHLHRRILEIGSRSFRLRPVGDLQFGTPGFRKDIWDRWKKEMMEDKQAYAIGMGDYSDSFRPTIQKKLESAFIGDGEARRQLEEMLLVQTQHLAKEMEPFKDRIIGLLEGHHFFTLSSGDITTTQYLCQLLGVKYLGFEAAIQLIVRRGRNGKKSESRTIDIYATHGCGGSKHTNSDMSKLEREIMPFWDVDLFLRGHSTKVYAAAGAPLNKYSANMGNGTKEMRILKRQRLLVNTGGFMEGRVDGHTSYVEQQGFPPCALGYAVVDVHIANPNNGHRQPDNWFYLEMKPSFVIPHEN